MDASRLKAEAGARLSNGDGDITGYTGAWPEIFSVVMMVIDVCELVDNVSVMTALDRVSELLDVVNFVLGNRVVTAIPDWVVGVRDVNLGTIVAVQSAL